MFFHKNEVATEKAAVDLLPIGLAIVFIQMNNENE